MLQAQIKIRDQMMKFGKLRGLFLVTKESLYTNAYCTMQWDLAGGHVPPPDTC